MAQFVGRAKTRRTNRRLAQIRLDNPKALPKLKADSKYTPRQVRKVRRVSREVGAQQRVAAKQRQQTAKQKAAAKGKTKAPAPYNPLAPLTGDQFTQEEKAAENAKFGPAATQLKHDIGGARQTIADTASYYDAWKQALADSAATIKAADDAAANATQQRTDQAYSQDSAALAQRDAASAKAASLMGRAVAPSQEGAQAVAAERSQGNQTAGQIRAQGAADTALMAKRGANAVLAKAQAVNDKESKLQDLLAQRRDLKTQRGDFKYTFATDQREKERTYALARKEFGLNKYKAKTDRKQVNNAAKQAQQSSNAQKIVAKIYAAADAKKARAQVRVAKLQLKKGKIDRKQYKKIVTIYHGIPKKPNHITQDITYHGLPKKGQVPTAKGGGKGKQGPGSGKNGALAPWEKDKVNTARHNYDLKNFGSGDRGKAIAFAVKHGVPARLARIAWSQYLRAHGGAPTARGNGSRGMPGGPSGTGRL